MKIEDLFRQLSFGELSNLFLSGEGSGEIKEEKHGQLLQFTEEALLKLHGRFVLRERTVMVEQFEHITQYHLRLEYAVSAQRTRAAKTQYPYIKDTVGHPFEGDVLKVLAVHDEFGRELALNDSGKSYSLFTPQPQTIQVPRPVSCALMMVTYQASHVKLSRDPAKMLTQEINLPIYLEIPLRNYIGYLVYSGMNGQDNTIKGQEYLGSYEANCLDVETRDLVSQSYRTSHTKLEDRGFA